ncbi:MAG TPA: hypothetical protein VE981_19815, partial [Planctomycetota bacterium]|nr:hypothetical protein [Planctomycetota bacterium]
MIRETLNANAANAFMAQSRSNGATFQRRVTAGGVTTSTAGAAVGAPTWVRLQRAGNLFTASTSPDGINWTVVGTDTVTMAATVQVGIAVTSHNGAMLNCATVDSIGGSGGWAGAASPPPPAGGDGGGGGGGGCGLTGLEFPALLLLRRTRRQARLSRKA